MHSQRNLPASLDLLRGFEAAARHLSFTRAGAELFLTQSAVSRQVQTLEEQLGVKLFQRRTRALVLTEAGNLVGIDASTDGYKERGRAKILDKPTRAALALADGRLFARDGTKLVCVKLK